MLRGLCFLKLLARANDLGQLIDHCVLFVNGELRVTGRVDEQHMGDLELDLFLNLSRHLYFSTTGCFASSTIFSKRGSPRSGSKKGSRRSSPYVVPAAAGILTRVCSCSIARSRSPVQAQMIANK